MHEKILQKRLTNYWELARKGQSIPQAERLDPETLSDVIGNCCIWRVEIGNQNAKVPFYTCEYLGDQLKEVIGKDITGEIVSPRMRKMPVPSARIIEKIEIAAENKAIIEDQGRFVSVNDTVVEFKSLLLPFGNKKEIVTAVLIGMTWRSF